MKNLKFGNIITYVRSDGEIITHRIKFATSAEGERAYITQGDNNEDPDEEVVRYDAIIGKVVYTMPMFGKLVKILKNKIVFTSSLIFLILVLVYDIRVTNRKKERKNIRKEYENKSDFYF